MICTLLLISIINKIKVLNLANQKIPSLKHKTDFKTQKSFKNFKMIKNTIVQ